MIDEEITITEFSKLSYETKDSFENIAHNLINEWNIFFNSKKNSYSASIANFLNDISILNSYKNYFDVLDIDEFIDWNSNFQKDQLQHMKDGHNFNIFYLLKNEFDFVIQETMHSKLIKFLLNSREMHGLGNLFLVEFLKNIGIESPEDGIWEVTAEQGKIDILIERKYPQSVIIIENKSNWACDQENQLYRYWYKAIYLKTRAIKEEFYNKNNQKYQIIYLSPNSHKQYDEQSIRKPQNDQFDTYNELPDKIPMKIASMTFDNDIQKWLNDCKNVIPETNHRIREYISQYQMLCKTL